MIIKKVEQNGQVEKEEINGINMKLQKLKIFNFCMLVGMCFFIGSLCIINSLQIQGMIIICCTILLISIRWVMRQAEQSDKQNNEQQQQGNQQSTIISNFRNVKLKYIQFSILGLHAAIYIAIFEYIINYKDNHSQIIIISLFLQLYSIMVISKIKQVFISLSWVFIIQIYIIIRQQFLFEFKTINIFLNIIYFLYSVSYFNTSVNTIQKKNIIQQQSDNRQNFLLRLYKNILSIIPEGLAVINSEKKLLYANPTLKKILQSNKKSDIRQILLNLGNSQQTQQHHKKNILEQSVSKQFTPSRQGVGLNSQQLQLNSLKKINSQFNIPQNKQNNGDNLKLKESMNRDESQNQVGQKDIHQQEIQISINNKLNNNLQDSNKNDIVDLKNILLNSCKKQNDYQIKSSQTSLQNISKNLAGIPVCKQDMLENRLGTLEDEQLKEDSSSNYSRSKQQKQQSIRSSNSLKSNNIIKKGISRDSQKKVKSSILKQQTFQSTNIYGTEQSDIISYKGFGLSVGDETITEVQQNSQILQLQCLKGVDQIQQTPDNSPKSLKEKSLNQKNSSICSQYSRSKSSYSRAKSSQRAHQKKQLQHNYSQQILKKQQYNPKQINKTQRRVSYSDANLRESNQIQQQEQNNNQSDYSQKKSFQSKDQNNNPSNNNININVLQIQNQQKNQFNDIIFENNVNKITQNIIHNINIDLKVSQAQKELTIDQHSKVKDLSSSIPFKLKVKTNKHISRSNIDWQISSKKTNVQSIIEKLFSQSPDSKQDQHTNRNDAQQSAYSKNKEETSFIRQTSFTNQVRQTAQPNITYFQQTDTIAKMQVQYKKQDLVLQFLQVDALAQNEKKDPLILIMVQDMWQDLYQKKVQDIQKDKMRLFASLSHELRTPLNCSISMLEVLTEEISQINPGLIEEYLNPALFSNKLLLNQINDLLDFVQMDSGKFKYSYFDFNIFSLFKDCQKLISMQAQMKNLEIKIKLDANVPEFINSDPNRIRQIILNFLSNSLKFTKKGFIEMGIISVDQKQGLYQVYVRDTGIGIKKENIETIFNFCAKVEYNKNDENLNRYGCGLGLTISNSIAKGLVKSEQVRGGIKVESDYGQGSTFSILIQDMVNQKSQVDIFKEIKLITESIQLDKQFQSNLHETQSFEMGSPLNQDFHNRMEYLKKKTQKKQQLQQQLQQQQQQQQLQQQVIISPTKIINKKPKMKFNNSQMITEDENSYFDGNNTSVSILKQPYTKKFFNNQTINVTENKMGMINCQFQQQKDVKVDSSNILELEEDVSRNFKIHSNQYIKHQGQRFEEVDECSKQEQYEESNENYQGNEEDNNDEEQGEIDSHNIQSNFSISKKIILKSIPNSFRFHNRKSSPRQSRLIDSKTFDFRNFNDSDTQIIKLDSNERNKPSDENNKLQSDVSIEYLKKNVFSNLNNKFKTATTSSQYIEKQDKSFKDQEGFTSYLGFSRFIENQISSQRLISNTFDNKEKSSMKLYSQKEFEDREEASKKRSDFESYLTPQEIINCIVENNKQLQFQCNCPQLMIVDDNQFNLYAISKIAQQYFFRYITVSDGFQALEEVKSIFHKNCCRAPKIIFMDIEMPLKNGYETTIEITEFYESIQLIQQQPITIACTAYVGQEDLDSALKAGMRDFINKPILKNAFESLILNWKNLFL